MAVSIGVSLLSALLAPKPKKTTNDNMPTSACGADIPRIFGIARVPTTIIYASKVRQKRKGKGGGLGKGNNKKYFGNMAAVIGEGERPFLNGRGALTLRRIFLNDKIWVDYTAQATPDLVTDTTKREEYFEFYGGSLTQTQDPTLVAQLGTLNVSSYRSLSYIVFTNLELTDFGGNYPTVKVEVVANDLVPNFNTIAEDLMYRVGRRQMRPLVQYADYTFATTIETPITIDGYILSQDVSDYRTELANLLQVFRKMQVQRSDAWGLAPALGAGTSLNHRAMQCSMAFIPSQGIKVYPYGVRTGASTAMYQIPQPYSYEAKDAGNFPSEMHFSYIQPRLDFEREVVVASRASQGLGDTTSLSFNAIIQDRSVASSIATYLIREGWNRIHHVKYRDSQVPLLGTTYPLALPQSSVSPNALTTRVEIGSDGRTEVLGVVSSTPQTENVGQNAFAFNTYDSAGAGPENILWTDGASQDGATTKSALVFVSPKVGAIDNGVAAPVLMSIDGGSTYLDIGTALSANCYKVPLVVTGKNSRYTNATIDIGTKLTITVPPDTQLFSITREQLWFKTKNLIFLGEYGMVAFQTATALGNNMYELTNLLWDIEAQEANQTTAFPLVYPSFGWLMLSNIYTVSLPAAVSSSVTLGIFDDSGSVLNSYTKKFLNANQEPKFPINSRIVMETNGGMTVHWSAGVNQSTGTPAQLFEDNITTATSHKIIVFSYSKPGNVFYFIDQAITTNTNKYTFSAATLAGWVVLWGVSLKDLAVVVDPRNGLGDRGIVYANKLTTFLTSYTILD